MNPDFHHIPGRLRVRAPRLKRDERAAATVRAQLERLPGVTSARVNVVTGSVTVTYDREAPVGDQVIDALAESGYVAREIVEEAGAGLDAAASRALDISASRAGEVLARATFGFVVEKVIERSALALIGAIA